MKTNETTFNPTDITGFYNVTRDAQELRAAQTARIFRVLARWFVSGYSRLVSHGASINAAHRPKNELF